MYDKVPLFYFQKVYCIQADGQLKLDVKWDENISVAFPIKPHDH